MLAMSKIFFIGRSSTARQTGSLPPTSENKVNGAITINFTPHVHPEDAAHAPAWNIGVVVIFGEVRLNMVPLARPSRRV